MKTAEEGPSALAVSPLGIRVTAYAELKKIVHVFAAGHFQLLFPRSIEGLTACTMRTAASVRRPLELLPSFCPDRRLYA
jgi:hypothetical protein